MAYPLWRLANTKVSPLAQVAAYKNRNKSPLPAGLDWSYLVFLCPNNISQHALLWLCHWLKQLHVQHFHVNWTCKQSIPIWFNVWTDQPLKLLFRGMSHLTFRDVFFQANTLCASPSGRVLFLGFGGNTLPYTKWGRGPRFPYVILPLHQWSGKSITKIL